MSPILFYQATEVQKRMPCFDVDPDRLQDSLHISGQAADIRLSSRSVKQIFKAAAKCNGGGVGRYYRSNFVHMDCGPIRTWRG